jgi:hypothetical protein
MSREERVVVRCSAAEKRLLGEVALAMQRTLSDAVRILVFEKARDLEILVPAVAEIKREGLPVKNSQPESGRMKPKKLDLSLYR